MLGSHRLQDNLFRRNHPVVHYYSNPLGSINFNPLGFVQLTWTNQPIVREELTSLYAHTLSALRHHSTCMLLTDQRLRQPLPEEDQRWIAEKWIPQAVAECSYSHCAILESSSESHRVGARNVGVCLLHRWRSSTSKVRKKRVGGCKQHVNRTRWSNPAGL
jgi:hypothetical protein